MGVALYTIQIGDEEIEFEGPDGLTDEQIEQLADKHLKTAKPGQKFRPSVYGGDMPDEVEAEPDPEQSSALGTFFRGLPKDALFNFDDEISSFANAAIPGLAELDNLTGLGGEQQGPLSGADDFWSRVRGNMGGFSDQAKTDAELHPVADAAGRITGALSTLPRAAAGAVARLPEAVSARLAARPVSASVSLGAGGGAVSGFGAGEEGTRGQSAALGLLAGGALGGTVAGGMELAPAIANYAKIFFNRGADKEAITQMIKALQRDGFDVSSPSGVQKLRDTLQEFTGKPISLADVGGATRSRAGVGLRTPSEAQQVAIGSVRERQAGQGQRLAQDIREGVAPRTDVFALEDDLVAQRAQAAESLRERALFEDVAPPVETPLQIVNEGPNAGVRRAIGMDDSLPTPVEPPAPPTPAGGRTSRILDPARYEDDAQYQTAVELQNLMRLPDAQKALQGALARSEAERARLAATGQSIDHLPDLSASSNLDVRTVDYLKRYLDDEVNALYRRGQGSTFSAGEAAQVRALRDDIRDRLKTLVPEYADYLDQYAGSSEMIDALKEGQLFDRLSPEQIAADQARRSTAGQELYRVGAARNLLDVIRETKDTGNAASRVLNSEEARNQLLATGVDPAKAADLNRSISQERTLNLLPQELAGSQTAQRAISQADANAGVDMTFPFNPGSPLGWAGMLARGVRDRVSVNRNASVNEALLPRMTTTDPTAIQSIIGELETQGKFLEAAQLRQRAKERQLSLLGGSVIGSPVALQGE